jgi:hypothetical protein
VSDEPVMVAETLSYARVGESVWPRVLKFLCLMGLVIALLHVLAAGVRVIALLNDEDRFGFNQVFGRWSSLVAGVFSFIDGAAGAALGSGAIATLRRWDARRVMVLSAAVLALVAAVEFGVQLLEVYRVLGSGSIDQKFYAQWFVTALLFYGQYLAFPLVLALVLELSRRDEGAAAAFQ